MSSEALVLDGKPNGNVHDDDVTKSRTRVSRACTRCRMRKDRCDGQRPSCTACVNAQQICCYEPSTKKRGLPEGYVRGLEKLYALLIGKVDGFEAMTSRLLKDNHAQISKIWNHAVIGEELHTSWKESRIIAELESLLSSLDQTGPAVGHKRKRDKEDEGSGDDNDLDMTFHLQPEHQISHLKNDNTVRHAPEPSQTAPPGLPKQSLQLLDHYFAHTNCWFPILRRPDLSRACYEMARGQATEASEAIASLLWAVFAYALKQLGSFPDADFGTLGGGQLSAEDMRAVAMGLIPNDAERCTITHAQALLILSLSDIGLDHWKSAWISVGKAVRICLSCISDSKNLDKLATSTLQGCVILDTAIASHLKCIPHLRRQDLEMVPRLVEDGHEEWEPWTGSDGFRGQREPSFSISCFNRLTEIHLCVGDVLTMNDPSEMISTQLVQGLLAKLHELQGTFPGPMPPTIHSPPHQIYLQLCHVSAQMHLVELPVQTGARSSERAKLACNLLSLLALCKNVPAIQLLHVPPLLHDGCATALRLAQTSVDSFGAINGLPSFTDFCQTAKDYMADLSAVWPVFGSLRTTLANLNLSSSARSHTTNISPGDTASHDGRSMTGNPVNLDRSSSTAWQRQRATSGTHADPATRSWSIDTGDAFNDGQMGINNNGIFGTPTEIAPQAFVNNLDGRLNGTLASYPAEQIMVETSPSFHGDEIDAIFHEMAHLDTNEWTSERAVGLKDFGFSDDMTFQAFCNDPDRLSGLENPHTLSSSLQTWMFTSDPPPPA